MTKEDDNMCFWRCLAKHLNNDVVNKKLVRISKELYKEYYNIDSGNYLGVNISEFDEIENKFDVEIRVYELSVDQNGNIEAIIQRRSKDRKNCMSLGLYENHFVYIFDVNKLCKSFRCDCCGYVFNRHDNLVTHQRNSTCEMLYKEEFVKDIQSFECSKNIMKEILTFCKAKDKSFMYPYFGVYDFESLALLINKRKGENTIILNKQVPVSFSIGSNMNANIIHEVNKNPSELVIKLVDNMFILQKEASKRVFNEFYYYIKKYCTHHLGMVEIISNTKIEESELKIIFFDNEKYYVLSFEQNEKRNNKWNKDINIKEIRRADRCDKS